MIKMAWLLLFNIFINSLYHVLQSDLHTMFADDNTICAISNAILSLVTSLIDKAN